MFKIKQPLFLINQTPLHAGSGSDLGIVDLPIQRERHTGFPKIEGSSLKGALRHDFEADNNTKHPQPKYEDAIKLAFGPEDGDAHAGALGFTDARLLLFPVRSVKGVFAWVTCPRVLRQFERDMKIANADFSISGIPNPDDKEEMKAFTLSDNTTLKATPDLVILEEYAFTTSTKNDVKVGENPLNTYLADTLFEKGSYWHGKIQKDLIIVSDTAFGDFVQLSTEVITRTKIDPTTGTVVGGALFTEEYLPTETVMYSLILAAPTFVDVKKKGIFQQVQNNEAGAVMQFFKDGLRDVVQIGGSATIGKGLVRTIFNYSNQTT